MKKIKDCSTCKFQKVPSKTHPCNVCSHQASGCITSMWKAVSDFSSVCIIQAQPGTMVGKNAFGENMVVTDKTVVFNGPKAWVTPKMYALIKKQ